MTMRHDAATREETAEVILDAAERLLQHYGYGKTTVDDIAREAGVGKGTIYLYFRSKEEVALSCVDRLNATLRDGLRAIAQGEGAPAERLRRMLLARILMRFDNAHGYARSLDEMYAALRHALFERRARQHETEADILAEVLVEGRVLKQFCVPDAMAAARTLVLATNALLPYSLSPAQLGERAEIEKRAERLIDMLLFGLCARGSVDCGSNGQTVA